ncbi:MAG TPA: hypothetical protein VF516_26260 [Kofleriaceae bacterium]
MASSAASEGHRTPGTPGKATLTEALPVIAAPVQRKADPVSERFDDTGVHQAAAAGVAGGGGQLPHVAETIRVYVSNKDTPRFAEYQKIVPHRFEILKKEYDK